MYLWMHFDLVWLSSYLVFDHSVNFINDTIAYLVDHFLQLTTLTIMDKWNKVKRMMMTKLMSEKCNDWDE
jgi:hypothetical protein